MILLAVLLLLILGSLLMFIGRRRSAALLVILSLVILAGAATAFVPRLMLGALSAPFEDQPPPAWAETNAIILLGAGSISIGDGAFPSATAYGRIVRTVEAYRNCKADGKTCSIVVSGGDPRNKGIAEADLYASSLNKLGVPASDMVIENRSRNTFENARLTAEIFSDGSVDRYFIVTSGYHMRRGLLFFGHFGIDAEPLPAFMVMPEPSWIPKAYSLLSSEIALHEYVGRLQYDVYNIMGWNPARVEKQSNG